MISTMDMATGQWEINYTVPDVRMVSDDSTPYLDTYDHSLLHYGLCEHVTARPLCAGMPVVMATQDVDDFLARMDEPAR
jgi:hypothetical protein